MHSKIVLALILAALAMLVLPVYAATPAPTAATLALHPECFALNGTVVVRGAVTAGPTDAPVAGATVVLRDGAGQAFHGTTGADGIYNASIEADGREAGTVREVRTVLPAVTGSRVVLSEPGHAVCQVASVSMGPLQQQH